MEGAFRAWADTCKVHNGGKSAFTGPFYGRHWEAFKKSIADHGPFENSNDERLRKMAELERSERHTVWAEKSRRWRVIARERQQLLHKPPSANFIKAAVNERERRSQSLEIAAGRTDLPRRISKIPAAQAGKTAELTADVWLQGELLLAMGQGGKPGRIASALVSQGRNHGLAYASLKARIKSDLARGLELEKLGIWQPFDPDCDLADQQSMPGGDHDYSHAVHSNDESLTAEQMVDLLSLLWPRLDLPTT